jgi:hypothetical protein
MHIIVIDRWRNVRVAPKKAPTQFFFGALREILVGHDQARAEGQLEFECDREFLDALNAQAERDARTTKGKSANVLGERADGRPTFEGVPIVVLEPEAQP